MALRLKNTSAVRNYFGIVDGYGAFANNEIIKKNPQLVDILTAKRSKKVSSKLKFFKKRPFDGKVNDSFSQFKEKVYKHYRQNASLPKTTPVNTNTKTPKQEIKHAPEFRSYKWKSEKKHRYYNVYLQPTLFSSYTVTKSWGGIGIHLGNYKTMMFDSLKAAYLEIAKITKQRERKGYIAIRDNLN